MRWWQLHTASRRLDPLVSLNRVALDLPRTLDRPIGSDPENLIANALLKVTSNFDWNPVTKDRQDVDDAVQAPRRGGEHPVTAERKLPVRQVSSPTRPLQGLVISHRRQEVDCASKVLRLVRAHSHRDQRYAASANEVRLTDVRHR
jgi:hypothetical protein